MELTFIGIGSGNPDQLTCETISDICNVYQVLIPVKANERQELSALRDAICDLYLPANGASAAIS